MPGAHGGLGVWVPRTVGTDNCNLPCECLEFKPGCREEQIVLLTTKPSLQQPSVLKYLFSERYYQNVSIDKLVSGAISNSSQQNSMPV